jgi:hypothetical protein
MGGVGATFKFVTLAATVAVGLSALGGLSVTLDDQRQRNAAKADFQRRVAAEAARLSEAA